MKTIGNMLTCTNEEEQIEGPKTESNVAGRQA